MTDIQIQKRRTFRGHSSGIYCLQLYNSNSILSAGGDGQVVLWDIASHEDGKVIARLDSTVYGMLVDNDHLLVGENSRALHMIDLSKNEVLRAVEVKSPIFDIHKFDDKYLVGTGAGELLTFDLELNLIYRTRLSDKSLRSIASYGDQVALGFSDNCIRIVDKNFETITELKGHSLSVFSLQYFQENNVLISTGRDAHIRGWDLTSSYAAIKDISAHLYAINHLVISPNRKYFATGSMDKSIKIWDAVTFALVKVIDKVRHDGHTNSVNKLLWMDFENLLVTCSDDRTIAVWDINID